MSIPRPIPSPPRGATRHLMTDLLMAGLYVVAIVPVGLMLRALGKDLLRAKWEDTASTYWIKRSPPGPSRGSMAKQF